MTQSKEYAEAPWYADIWRGLFGLIVVFPVPGHATWNACRAIRSRGREGGRVFFSPA